MGAEGFWDDQANAAKVSAEHARVQRRLEEFRALESDVDDLEELEAMAAEDDSIAARAGGAALLDRLAPGGAGGGAPVRRRLRRAATPWSR